MAQALAGAARVVRSISSLICCPNSPKPLIASIFSPTPSKIGGVPVRYVRVGHVEIPNDKRLRYSLQYIHGIGQAKARQVLCDLAMENKLTKDLSGKELADLRDEVLKYRIETDLEKFKENAIRRLKTIKCYRGMRHEQLLSCRGQRTRTNCRTLKERRKGTSRRRERIH